MTKINVLDKGFVRLVDSMGNDKTIVKSARVSYGAGTKTKRQDKELINYLIRHRHTSPIEMVEFTFHIKAPLFIARQFIRHRMAGINEVSARYSVIKDEFYIPAKDRLGVQCDKNKQGTKEGLSDENKELIIQGMKDDCEFLYSGYEDNLKRGLSRELARITLPVNIYTEWYWKMDLHNLLHFLKLRDDSHAQWEIQQYAKAIYELIKPIVPNACEAYENYVKGAVSFSKKEQEGLRQLLSYSQVLNFPDDMSKGEQREFNEKLEKIKNG